MSEANTERDSSFSITLREPDDWHIHLRDGVYLRTTVADASKQFARAIVMPNLQPPITTIPQLNDYYQRIQRCIPIGRNFEPLMTLYVTKALNHILVKEAAQLPRVAAFKLYFSGSTTHSQYGIDNLEQLLPLLELLERYNMPLLIHGERADPEVDIFDREAWFIEHYLQRIVREFPNLRVVLEHITTKTAVEFITSVPKNLAATITAHHLWCNRNHLLAGGIRPHYYCLPILKRKIDQQALIQAATSGDSRFFLGTDSAPHARADKECAHGCAGVYTAHAALELYATIFAQVGRLDRLEDFASVFGAAFYGFPLNSNTVRLVKQRWQVSDQRKFGSQRLVPFAAGQFLDWRLVCDSKALEGKK